MNILMTGGTGFIGSGFIDQFSEHSFTILTRQQIPTIKNSHSIQLINSLDQLTNLDRFDAVINLAGEPIIDKRWSQKQKTEIKASRLNITNQLVHLFSKSTQPPEVFISGSAIGIYGNRGDEVLTEASTVKNTDFPTELCMQWEESAMQAQPYTRVVTLRTGIVLKQDGGALVKMLLPFKLGIGGKVGSGQQYMSWIHFQDYLAAISHILKNTSITGAVNLVAPEPEKNIIFTKILAKTLNRFAVLPIPKQVLRLLLGEASCLLLDSQRVVPTRLLESGFTFKFQTLTDALNDLLVNKHR